jgi:hypothetical protein
VKSGATVWYQSQGFDTEPRWASGVVFGPRVRGEIVSGGPISDPGMVQSVKELLDHAFKLMRYSGVVKPQPGVVYGHKERGLHTSSAGALGSIQEGSSEPS